MKLFILFLSLFMLLTYKPTTVLAVTKPYLSSYTSPIFTPKTKEIKPKWVKILEWAVLIFLLLAIILFLSSLGPASFWGYHTIVKSMNFRLCLIAFGVAITSAMTLFARRMLKLIEKA